MVRRAVLLLALIAPAGCVQEAEQADSAVNAGRIEASGVSGDSPAGPGGAAPSVVLARLPDSREGAGAAMAGTLRIREGCVYLEDRDGSLLLLGVTNPDIRWDAEARALAVGGRLIRDGDALEVGGAEVSGAGRASLAWREPRPDTCDDRRIWVTSAITIR